MRQTFEDEDFELELFGPGPVHLTGFTMSEWMYPWTVVTVSKLAAGSVNTAATATAASSTAAAKSDLASSDYTSSDDDDSAEKRGENTGTVLSLIHI